MAKTDSLMTHNERFVVMYDLEEQRFRHPSGCKRGGDELVDLLNAYFIRSMPPGLRELYCDDSNALWITLDIGMQVGDAVRVQFEGEPID